METIQRNRVTSAIVGGAIVLIVIALLSSRGGGDDEPSFDFASSEPDARSTPMSATDAPPEEYPRTDQTMIACEPLLTLAEEEAALGLDELPFAERSTFELSRNETCTTRLASNEDVFLQITPGTPEDFAPGTTRLGVVGAFVDGIGDGALWFGGPDSTEGGDAGVLAVGLDTPSGLLVFRIVISRPGVAEAVQREAAETLARAALTRFPWVAEAPPPPPRTVERPAPPDLASLGYVENLLAKEAAGEWTFEEGLVATLQTLVGETDRTEVLANPDPLQFSSQLIALARDYLETGSDTEAQAEIIRLLDKLLPLPSEEAITAAPPLFSRALDNRGQQATASILQEQPCTSYFEDEELCWGSNDIEPDLYGQGTYELTGPAQGGFGWELSHVQLAERAMIEALSTLHALGIPPPPTSLIMLPNDEGDVGGVWKDASNAEGCVAYVTPHLQSLSERHAEQVVAGVVARCSLADPTLFASSSLATGAWGTASVWFLSDVIFPNADLETHVGLPADLAGVETGAAMPDYDAPNWAFLEQIGVDAALDVLRLVSLNARTGIEQEHHEYAARLTEGTIADGGGEHSYDPPSESESLAGRGTVNFPVKPLQAMRLELSVDGGEYACASFPSSGSLMTSWGTGSPGSVSLSQALPDTLSGTVTFVVTSTQVATFSIKVDDFVSDPGDCEEEEEERTPPSDGTPCDICDPSFFLYDFFINWGNVTAGGVNDGPSTTSGGGSSGGGSGSGGGASGGGGSPGGGGPPDDDQAIRAYVAAYCVAYEPWHEAVIPSDGVDPTTLSLDARLERANAAAISTVEASRTFLAALDELEPPAVMMDFHTKSFDPVEFLLFDMEDYVDDPADSLEEVENLSLEYSVGVEFLWNTIRAEARRLDSGAAASYRAALDANQECAQMPR